MVSRKLKYISYILLCDYLVEKYCKKANKIKKLMFGLKERSFNKNLLNYYLLFTKKVKKLKICPSFRKT